MTSKRRSFTPGFKSEAVRLVQEEGYSVSEAARNLGIDHSVLRRWLSKSVTDSPEGTSALQAEVLALRKENKRLRMEREILKKAAAFFARESQ